MDTTLDPVLRIISAIFRADQHQEALDRAERIRERARQAIERDQTRVM